MSYLNKNRNNGGTTSARHTFLKRTAVSALSAAMVLISGVPALGSSAFAASTWKSVPAKAVVKADGTAVRKSASTSSKKLATVNKNVKYTISYEKFTSASSTKAKTRWIYVSSLKGFIRTDLTKVTLAKKAAWTTDALRLRKGAGTSFASLGLLQKGTSLYVRERVKAADGSKWYRVKANGKNAYVTASYVTFTNPSSGDSTNANTNTDNNDSTNDSTKTAVNPDANATTSTPILNGTGKVTASKAVVRQKASNSAASIKTLKKGAELTVTSETFTSSKSTKTARRWVYASNVNGYVRRDQISLSYPNAVKVTVDATGGLNTRKGPGTSFAKSGQVADGASIKAKLRSFGTGGSAESDVWYRVAVSGKNVYVKGSFLKFTSSSTDTDNDNTNTDTDNTTTDTTSYITKDGFPSSYLPYLQALHAAHPTWKFTPALTNLDWSDAVTRMMANSGTNTIQTGAFPATYFSVEPGCFNYLTGTYTPKDSSAFVAASAKTVQYYMNPRNWMTDKNVFMFLGNNYRSYQDADTVQTILNRNSVLKKSGVADMFVAAGKTYNVSPVYLASKAIAEQGTTTSLIDGSQGAYNVFNIGASDSTTGGASNGIAYAKAQGWTTLEKAITGGAQFLSKNFINNNQYTAYLEHFNVLNGQASVGTHIYMSAVYASVNTAASSYNSYSANNVLEKPLEFDIPVYSNMPASACGSPAMNFNLDNNYYLKSLSVTVNGTRTVLISSDTTNYSTQFDMKAGSTDTVTIDAAAASKTGATVTGNMSVSMNGQTQQTATIVCTSSSGETRTYMITITAQ